MYSSKGFDTGLDSCPHHHQGAWQFFAPELLTLSLGVCFLFPVFATALLSETDDSCRRRVMNFHPTGPCLRIFPVHCEDLRFCLGHDCKHFQRKKTEPGGPGRGERAVRRNWSFVCFCFTWDGEEGEDPQRNDAELCEGEVHADDVYQNLLGHVGGPEHHKAELEGGGGSQVVRKRHQRVE